MSLKEIFCQDKAIDVLGRAFASGKVAHAYIFAGPEGVGKFKTASEWAKLLLCGKPLKDSPGFADSCGVCESCKLFEVGSHSDFNNVYKELVEFTKDGKGKKTPVDLPKAVIQEFLIDKVSARPVVSERKVFVVSEAEKLNTTSQNSLLKVLEEPPEFCCIILLCTRLEKLLATIRSRCQIVRFGFIDEQRIIEKLKETGVEAEMGKYFARFCGGSIGAACQWGRLEAEGADFYNAKKELVEEICDYRYADALDLAERFLEESKRLTSIWYKLDEKTSKTDINRRVIKGFISIIVLALKDAMEINILPPEKWINFDQAEQIKKLARRIEPELAAEKIVSCYESMRKVEASVNEKLIFEQLLLNLAICDNIAV